jgi:protein-disulfide isomerase
LAAVSAGLVAAVLTVTPRLYLERESEIAGGITGMAVGRTAEGHNWIGAERPEVVIVEYSDYECPHCRLAHQVVREVVRERQDWLRLVHVHMPLDHTCNPALGGRPFHRYSCACARAAICADRQDRFWEVNDALFIRRGGLDAGGLTILAASMGLDAEAFRACMKSAETEGRLRADLGLCRRLGLKPATPTFSLEGMVIVGSKKKEWWAAAVDKMRARKNQAASPGGSGKGEGK